MNEFAVFPSYDQRKEYLWKLGEYIHVRKDSLEIVARIEIPHDRENEGLKSHYNFEDNSGTIEKIALSTILRAFLKDINWDGNSKEFINSEQFATFTTADHCQCKLSYPSKPVSSFAKASKIILSRNLTYTAGTRVESRYWCGHFSSISNDLGLFLRGFVAVEKGFVPLTFCRFENNILASSSFCAIEFVFDLAGNITQEPAIVDDHTVFELLPISESLLTKRGKHGGVTSKNIRIAAEEWKNKIVAAGDYYFIDDVLFNLCSHVLIALESSRCALPFEPLRCFMLCGPSGSGKTDVIRKLISTSFCNYYEFLPSMIIKSREEDSEGYLEAIFREAGCFGPSIIFIDEFDSLCPAKNVSQPLMRICSLIRTLMDDLRNIKNCVLIVTSRSIESVDETIVQSGRFSMHYQLSMPDELQREALFRELISKKFEKDLVNICTPLAKITKGISVGDIKAIIRDLLLSCKVSSGKIIVPESELESKLFNIASRYASLRQNINLEESPNQETTELVLSAAILPKLYKHMIMSFRYFKLLRRIPSGVLLHGPSGVGKSSLAISMARKASVPLFSLSCTSLISKILGHGEMKLSELFTKAAKYAPCILFLDRIEAIGKKRSGDDANISRMLSTMLTEIDGIRTDLKKESNILVVGATTDISVLDEAILRPGRLGTHIYIPLPEEGEIEEMLRRKLAVTPKEEDIDFKAISKMLIGCNGSDIDVVCREAAMMAVRENIAAMGSNYASTCNNKVSSQHLLRSVMRAKKANQPIS